VAAGFLALAGSSLLVLSAGRRRGSDGGRDAPD
jgi:hypothetical protein